MRNFYLPKTIVNHEVSRNVLMSLVRHVYEQSNIALIASLLCAVIIFISLLTPPQTTGNALYIWFVAYIVINLLRFFMVTFTKPLLATKLKLCRDFFTMGAILSGASWGLAGIILLPYASSPQQNLLILMLAGVTAGSFPLYAAIPEAAIGFLTFSLVPFIISIAFFKNYLYFLFDIALTIYFIYSITLVVKVYHLIKSSIELQFENTNLLKNLSDAKLQLEVINEKLHNAATHDPLTHVANRSLFQQKLENAIDRSKLNKSILALFFIDLDLFKLVNDVYGHDVGDQVLVVLINRIKTFFKSNVLQSDDIIARLGGDEITVILENAASLEEIKFVATQLCKLSAMPIHLDNKIKLKISASIGISIFPDDGATVSELLTRADKAMYRAKERGGNNFYMSKQEMEVV